MTCESIGESSILLKLINWTCCQRSQSKSHRFRVKLRVLRFFTFSWSSFVIREQSTDFSRTNRRKKNVTITILNRSRDDGKLRKSCGFGQGQRSEICQKFLKKVKRDSQMLNSSYLNLSVLSGESSSRRIKNSLHSTSHVMLNSSACWNRKLSPSRPALQLAIRSLFVFYFSSNLAQPETRSPNKCIRIVHNDSELKQSTRHYVTT